MTQESSGPSVASIERQLSDLNARIEALQKGFTLYFSGEETRPPEKERAILEQMVRSLTNLELQSPRLNLMLQNLTARFGTFNSMWLKRLHDKEAGTGEFKASRPKAPPPVTQNAGEANRPRGLLLTLGDEQSYEALYRHYADMVAKASLAPIAKEKMMLVITRKMAENKIDRADVTLTLTGGKLNLKVKRAP